MVVLIPKTFPAVVSVYDFRPISLCTFIYKICAKILSRRLRPLLPKLIGPEQGGFVAGRLIGDHILLASEVQHLLWNAYDSNAGAMRKIDLKKAFDKMSWSFVRGAMDSLGFRSEWTNWIMATIEDPSFGIKMNGKLNTWIAGCSGLRQGCPLSPFLFVICAELLTRLINREVLAGGISGIRMSPSAAPITHLLFADDMLFFTKAIPGNCDRLMSTISMFCDRSGQCINVGKSLVMVSRRAKPEKRAAVLQIFGLPEGREMGRYLGVPLITGRLGPEHFTDLQTRILGRIGGWRNRLLSFAGKICLVNYALIPMLFHVLGHCAVPAYIFTWLERQIRGFLWDHDPDIRKLLALCGLGTSL